MNERRETTRQVLVTKLCATCGADMRATGIVQMTYPPKYPHVCSADESHPQVSFNAVYPQVQIEKASAFRDDWAEGLYRFRGLRDD